MNAKDKETILNNISLLQKELEYNKFTVMCLNESGLYFEDMKCKIERTHSSTDDRLKALLIKLTKRGPTAFMKLLDICDRHFPDAARILRKEEISLRSNRQAHVEPYKYNERSNITLTPFTDELPPPTFFKKVIMSTRFPDSDMKCYKMRSKNRGVAFIVNIINFTGNKTRHGASVDRDNLVELFRQMGFIVMYYEDITMSQFFNLLEQLVVDDMLRDTECLVFTLMTHGRADKGWAKVEFSDSRKGDVEEIFRMFSNQNCPNMMHKPKVFFLPFCRGDANETALNFGATKNPPQSDGQPIAEEIPEPFTSPISYFADMKICYATSIGFAAQRDPELGAWYIESLCEIFAKFAHVKHLEELLKLTGESTRNKLSSSGHMQTPGNEDRGFYYTLYFNPGLYE